MQLKSSENLILQNNDINDDEHILNMWKPFNLVIDENYQYITDNILLNILSSLLYMIAFPILTVLNKLIYNFTVYGSKNLKVAKNGKITISNHVHPLDCTMIGTTNFPSPTYFLSLKSNFEIPLVRHLIKLLGAIPIPQSIQSKKIFLNSITNMLNQGKTLHIYPEGSLWPYYGKLRHFKNGAFKISIKNNIPIVPMVYKFKEPTGFRKILFNKPFIELHILPPIYPNINNYNKETITNFKEKVWNIMNDELNI